LTTARYSSSFLAPRLFLMEKRKTLREVDFGETENMASVNGPVASVPFFLVLQLSGGKKRSLLSLTTWSRYMLLKGGLALASVKTLASSAQSEHGEPLPFHSPQNKPSSIS
jgi:hypothetical protein